MTWAGGKARDCGRPTLCPSLCSRLPWKGAEEREACAGPARTAPRQLEGARTAAAVCGTSGGFSVHLSSASASERWEGGMQTLFIPGYRCRPTLDSLAPFLLALGGERSHCRAEVLSFPTLHSCPSGPNSLAGKRQEAAGPVPGQVLPMRVPCVSGVGGGESLPRPS